jgi:hypothetical protein
VTTKLTFDRRVWTYDGIQLNVIFVWAEPHRMQSDDIMTTKFELENKEYTTILTG